MNRQTTTIARLAAVGVALILVASCTSTDRPDGPAEQTLQGFYDHLNAGRLEDAKGLYDDVTRSAIFDGDGAAALFREWAVTETQDGTIEACTILTSTESEDGVTVEFELSFADGSKVSRRVTLTEQADGWRMGFIG